MNVFKIVKAVAIQISSKTNLTAVWIDCYTSLKVISVAHNALKEF